ncbi:acyl-CoA N-acyltransferase [Xylariomycetidae sp. FL0641]|nr:acyl-CoA N-acyltransferase [Xylariomycetidae sp. FL0641]
MPLRLEEVKDEQDFDQILPVLFAAFGEPYNTLRRWFIPVHTTEDAAIEAAKGRMVKNWKTHENAHWVKVTDSDTGDIIGAAEWEIRKSPDGPEEAQQSINAYWHTDGSEEKAFAEKLIGQLKTFMKKRMTAPHLELEQLVVHPEHRKRGAGKMLVEWGIHKADELGFECCVESVPFAVPIYERMGFRRGDRLVPDMSVPDPSPEWKEWQSEDLSVAMVWRPAKDDKKMGEDKVPRW